MAAEYHGGGTSCYVPISYSLYNPGYGTSVPGAAQVYYQSGTTVDVYIQTTGASGPITNGNLVVHMIHNGSTTALPSVSQPGLPFLFVFTVAAGILSAGQICVLGAGNISPNAKAGGAGAWAPYDSSAPTPQFGAFIPAANIASYSPGCTVTRYVVPGTGNPITNGNIVVDEIHNSSVAPQPGLPAMVVYTVAGGVLT